MAVEKNIVPYIGSIQSGVDKSYWVNKVADKIGVKEEIIWREVKKAGSFSESLDQIPKDDLVSQNKSKNRLQLLEEKILGIVLWKKDNSFLPDFMKSDVLDKLKEEDKHRLALEAELCYDGIFY